MTVADINELMLLQGKADAVMDGKLAAAVSAVGVNGDATLAPGATAGRNQFSSTSAAVAGVERLNMTESELQMLVAVHQERRQLKRMQEIPAAVDPMKRLGMTKLVRQQLRNLKEQFSVADTLVTGRLTRDQVMYVLHNAGLKTEEEELNNIVDELMFAVVGGEDEEHVDHDDESTGGTNKKVKTKRKKKRKPKKPPTVDYVRFQACLPYFLAMHYKLSRKALRGFG